MNIYDKHWRTRFMRMAKEVASWSKDPSTQVGCVIVNNGAIVATGYNGLPRGVEDQAPRMQRPAKYLWTAHAEENAIANAARTGASLLGATAFVTHHPCARCAGMLINAGVAAIVIGDGTTNMPEEEFATATLKFDEAGTTVVQTKESVECL